MQMSDADAELPSKTQRKKAMLDLQALGEELVDLSREQLAKFALPEILLDAILEAKRVTKHEARRRQGQYIGRLMRDVDTQNIRLQLDRIKGKSAQLTAYMHRLERWREQLIEDESALDNLATEHPGCDSQHLRRLIRIAREEREELKPPKAFRQLFQRLKELIPEPSGESS